MNLSAVDGKDLFFDTGCSQRNKYGEMICGDSFRFRKTPDGSRLTEVLSDGLGSGVKANILSTMTASMSLKFASAENISIVHAAETMMSALPVCRVRKISYATFTILNATLSGDIRIVEMGNPPFLCFQGEHRMEKPFRTVASKKWNDRTMRLYHFQGGVGDRIIFFSDGISQAGLGSSEYPLGWMEKDCASFISSLLHNSPEIGSRDLSERILAQALRKEKYGRNEDDMTCAVTYLRHPRRMLLFSGPPYDAKRDAECAEYIRHFPGDKVISGGTTSEIVSRELGIELQTDMDDADMELPPLSYMEGIDLVTEGVFTLTKTAAYLEKGETPRRGNPAGALIDILLRNDIIEILAGARVNEAHQDPKLPQELDLRRNIVQRLKKVLEEKYCKKVCLEYV